MKKFFSRYMLMMGVPKMEQISHWTFFSVFAFMSICSYIGGSLIAFLIVTFIAGSFWLVHALYTRHRYDINEDREKIPPPCAPP